MWVDPTVVWMPGGVRTELHLTGEDTGGSLCMLRDEMPKGWALPPHRHRSAAETIHVLAGEMGVCLDGGVERVARAGETVHVPAGVVHATRNTGEMQLRRLVVFSPAGMERFFLEAGASDSGGSDPQAVLQAALRHDWEFPG